MKNVKAMHIFKSLCEKINILGTAKTHLWIAYRAEDDEIIPQVKKQKFTFFLVYGF